MGAENIQTPEELLNALRRLRTNNPKAVRSTVHLYPARIYAAADNDDDKGEGPSRLRDRRITSWKMTEHMYYKSNNQFPTMARGLFTEELEPEDPLPPGMTKVGERIALRGYDKFFNIDEMEWTSVGH